MFKRDLIKDLHKMGVRYADKPGCGRVKLEHLKNADLAALHYKVMNENNMINK